MKQIDLISAANAGVNQTSAPLDLGDIKDFSVQVTFSSATLNGSLALESSNDNSNWTTVTGSTQAVVSGASHMWSVTGGNYRYARVTWTYTSGAGTVTAKATIKEYPIRGA